MKRIILTFLNLCFVSSTIAQDCADLFFSEYVEGPANNNGVEIYNPSNITIDLSDYSVNRYSGSDQGALSETYQLSGSLAPGQTITIGNGQVDSVWVNTYWSVPVDPVFFNLCNLHCSGNYPTPFYFNGDDALTLENNSDGIIDIIGKVGEDPGLAWTDDASAGYTDANGGTWWTKRQTLVRKPSVKKGVTMNPIVFNPTLEWDSLPDATYSGLGSHNCDCIISSTDNQIQSSYVVYPNPANIGDNIGVSTFDNIEKIILYNIEGKQFVINPINSKQAIIQNSELSSGNYILRILLENGNSIEHKLIVL